MLTICVTESIRFFPIEIRLVDTCIFHTQYTIQFTQHEHPTVFSVTADIFSSDETDKYIFKIRLRMPQSAKKYISMLNWIYNTSGATAIVTHLCDALMWPGFLYPNVVEFVTKKPQAMIFLFSTRLSLCSCSPSILQQIFTAQQTIQRIYSRDQDLFKELSTSRTQFSPPHM